MHSEFQLTYVFLNGIIRSRFSGYNLSLYIGHPVQYCFVLRGKSRFKNPNGQKQ